MSIIEPEILKRIISIKFIINLVENNLVKCKMYDNIYDEIDEVIRKNQCYNLKMLDINGEDLKNIGITNGKDIGEYLKKGLEYVLEEPTRNKKDIIIKYINKIYK